MEGTCRRVKYRQRIRGRATSLPLRMRLIVSPPEAAREGDGLSNFEIATANLEGWLGHP